MGNLERSIVKLDTSALKNCPCGEASSHLDRLLALPLVELGTCKIPDRVHRRVMAGKLGGELDHIPAGIAEIDRVDEAVMRDAAGLDAGILAFRQHAFQGRPVHL